MEKIIFTIGCLFLFSGHAFASGCTDMAKFNTTIDEFMKTASLDQSVKTEIYQLQSDCQNMHDLGMDVDTVDSCKKALAITQVN